MRRGFNTPPMRRGFNTSPMRRGFNTLPITRGFNTSPMTREFNTSPMTRENLLDSKTSIIQTKDIKEPEPLNIQNVDSESKEEPVENLDHTIALLDNRIKDLMKESQKLTEEYSNLNSRMYDRQGNRMDEIEKIQDENSKETFRLISLKDQKEKEREKKPNDGRRKSRRSKKHYKKRKSRRSKKHYKKRKSRRSIRNFLKFNTFL